MRVCVYMFGRSSLNLAMIFFYAAPLLTVMKHFQPPFANGILDHNGHARSRRRASKIQGRCYWRCALSAFGPRGQPTPNAPGAASAVVASGPHERCCNRFVAQIMVPKSTYKMCINRISNTSLAPHSQGEPLSF